MHTTQPALLRAWSPQKHSCVETLHTRTQQCSRTAYIEPEITIHRRHAKEQNNTGSTFLTTYFELYICVFLNLYALVLT